MQVPKTPMSLAKFNYQEWEYYRDERSKWANNAAEDEDFYIGKHYTLVFASLTGNSR